MNGAESLLSAAVDAGVDTCFANPGTTEMELVAALDRVPGIRGVLGLFEGVVSGAADGFGRVTGRPALTLTHLGPGFANSIANLHNARRAYTPVVNVIGDHATWHRGVDAPLTSDIESLAASVSKHVATVADGGAAGSAMSDAVATAVGAPTGVATLIVPQDAAWGAAGSRPTTPAQTVPPVRFTAVDDDIEAAAAALRQAGERGGILIGGVVRRDELVAATRIQAATGCRVWVDTFCAVLEAGRGVPRFDAVPYFPEQAIDALDGIDTMVLAGTRDPVAFFGYRSVGRSSLLRDDAHTITIAPPGVRGAVGLDALVAALGAAPAARVEDRPPADIPTGELDMISMGALVAARQPDGAIVVNEAATSGLGWAIASPTAAPHESFALTGGAIGQGLPAAVGAAIAAPDRPVIALQADGSGMYTLQALWTMARENLDVTVVVCANRAYRILQMELHRTGHDDAGPTARALTDLHDPAPEWTSLARGFGVEAAQATTLDELDDALGRGLSTGGPSLVEVLL